MSLTEEKLNDLKNAYKNREFTYFKQELAQEVSPIITWDFINSLLWRSRIVPPRLRLVKEGLEVKESLYFYPATNRKGDKIPRISEKELYKQIQNGATLVINSIDELHPELEAFVEKLEAVFQTPIEVNAYLSWKSSPGFKTHWDGHDVFIMQIDGKKDWFIFEDTLSSPTYLDNQQHVTPPTKLKWNQPIEKGDILYIPRGVWHHAIAFNEPSLHLTFGLISRTGAHFITWMANKLHSHEIFRKEISPLYDTEELDAQYNLFSKNIIDFLQSRNFDSFLNDCLSLMPKRTKFSLPYVGGTTMPYLNGDTQVGLNIRFLKLEFREENTIGFSFMNERYQYSEIFMTLHEVLQKHSLVSISEIHKQIREEIAMEELKSVIEKAVGEGILYVKA